ncbi:conserved hypothetical protein [Klebsiella grimontii]|uniref:Uncharacterized protein n=1 Tax=Klebsiella grimontii TaxID=2058152 RepID=A0A285B265_9ENTR|nr:conserved hypothetical protein [Klebsiella grimontii]
MGYLLFMKVLSKSNRGQSECEKNKKAGATRQKKHNEGANLID